MRPPRNDLLKSVHFILNNKITISQLKSVLKLMLLCLLFVISIAAVYLLNMPRHKLNYIESSTKSKGHQGNHTHQPTVVILTLMHNSETDIKTFKNVLRRLTYPRALISIAIGEDGSADKTVPQAKDLLHSLKPDFRRVAFHHFSSLNGRQKRWDKGQFNHKHILFLQKRRREHLAKARNMLLADGLKDEEWVLWIDSDIINTPPDIIEQMLSVKKDILVPKCVIKTSDQKEQLYDRNTWRESAESRIFKADPNFLFLEGYDQVRPKRIHLDSLENEGDLVEVDSVGGCVLLVKALHHKQGLNFPSYVFRNQIETEGFSKMAQALNMKLWALPKLKVYHSH